MTTDTEAIDRALAFVADEEAITRSLEPLAGALSDDDEPWPYR